MEETDMASSSPKQPSFEASISRLEEIVELADSPDTELETMISLVEEGSKLIRQCRKTLQNAELRIQTIENPKKASAPLTEIQDDSASFNLQ